MFVRKYTYYKGYFLYVVLTVVKNTKNNKLFPS